MKVNIKSYPKYIGPYQIADMIIFWDDATAYKLGTWLSKTPIKHICHFIYTLNKPKSLIKIDSYDIWSLDHTLSLIIHPALIKLKKTIKGGPHVDNEDIPPNLRSNDTSENETDLDNNYFHRWDYILDEMIWSFGEIKDQHWESQYHSGNNDIRFIPVDEKGNVVSEKNAKLFELKPGPNNTSAFDVDGYKAHEAKIQNGLRLFAKYYFALWF